MCEVYLLHFFYVIDYVSTNRVQEEAKLAVLCPLETQLSGILN